MKPYELMVLFHPDLEIDLDKALKKVENLIKEAGGSVTTSDVWGKRKLAYPVKKQDFAVYVYYEIQLPAQSIGQMETGLNIANEVLRYLITYPVPKSQRRRESADVDEEAEDNEEDKSEDKVTASIAKEEE